MKYLMILLFMGNIYASSNEYNKAQESQKKVMEVYNNSDTMKAYTKCLQNMKTPEDGKKCHELRQKSIQEMQEKMKNQ